MFKHVRIDELHELKSVEPRYVIRGCEKPAVDTLHFVSECVANRNPFSERANIKIC